MKAEEIIKRLNMQPHPEGGHFVETYRDPVTTDGRSVGTAIYFLLRQGEASHWHRVDAAEIWHFYAGNPLELSISADGIGETRHVLGNDLPNGEVPQIVVPAHHWQAARSMGEWTLVGCTVSPGFEFSRFELAAADWKPGKE